MQAQIDPPYEPDEDREREELEEQARQRDEEFARPQLIHASLSDAQEAA
mgnify:CR=1 FL=1